ncbi:hypothetical protein HK105_208990 [Polyrhizophydium stewartii]|uniref:Uncharacterized protein n=1 Tax=Polyrhizophydium stewartii TaxID=2732419 RepID=A0ABR4MWB8_9FUNG
MGRSAKFSRIGQTKSDRDRIKVAKNSRVEKAQTDKASVRKPAAVAAPQAPPPAAAPPARKTQASDVDMAPVAAAVRSARSAAAAAAAASANLSNPGKAGTKPAGDGSQPKSYVLGEKDYVSLMNSRRLQQKKPAKKAK